jgi:TPR repeat protein
MIMREKAPSGFDIDKFFKGIYTFQTWDIFPGHATKGPKNVLEHMRRLKVPERLDNLRILDIAPWNGFFGFECVRRGAASVTSLGPDDPESTGYNRVRDLLEIRNCTYIRASVYDLSPQLHGTFDFVLFLGVIYHLRHPLLALDRIWEVSTDRVFVDSPIIDNEVFDRTVNEDQRKAILASGSIMNQLPLAYFTKGSETGDPYNWFMPNRKAFCDFIESAGFVIGSYYDDGHWASIASTKGERSFVPGIEGYNPNAVTRNRPGAQPDHAEAAKWMRKAAEQGDPGAQTNLGFWYADGRGVQTDYAEAAKWMRMAAEQGHAAAQTNLGFWYANGQGVQQDFAEAAKWMRKAAEQGHAAAQTNLGFMYEDGQGVQQDDVEAAKWYRKAAERGHAEAQRILGSMYQDGRGVPKDHVLASMWLNLAGAQKEAPNRARG